MYPPVKVDGTSQIIGKQRIGNTGEHSHLQKGTKNEKLVTGAEIQLEKERLNEGFLHH